MSSRYYKRVGKGCKVLVWEGRTDGLWYTMNLFYLVCITFTWNLDLLQDQQRDKHADLFCSTLTDHRATGWDKNNAWERVYPLKSVDTMPCARHMKHFDKGPLTLWCIKWERYHLLFSIIHCSCKTKSPSRRLTDRRLTDRCVTDDRRVPVRDGQHFNFNLVKSDTQCVDT